MIKGISVWAFDNKRPLPEVFALAKQHNFESVEVAIALDGPITAHTTADECRHIAQQAREAGVQLSSLASGVGWSQPITAPDEAVRRQGIDFVAASLRVARDLGVDAILLVPGGVGAEFAPGFPGCPYDLAYELAQQAIAELAPIAEGMGVTIGIENVWNKFLLSPLEMRDFIDAAASDRVGCYFDTANVLLTGYPEQWIRILGKRTTRVHFKDFKRSVGTIDGFCDLLDGDVDYSAVMNSLRATGYDGFVTAEFFNCENDLAAISAAMDKILAL
jgi:hexulose-6-phosphate isomerase